MTTSHSTPPFKALLALDGSEPALTGARLLAELPLPRGSMVMLLLVLTPEPIPVQAALLDAVPRAKAILKREGLAVESWLLQGRAPEEVIRYAADYQPDLLVIGARGLHARPGVSLGAVAQQIVAESRWPVLVTREPFQRLRRVLLATDGSALGARAVHYLARFPLPHEATIQLMHVLPSQARAPAIPSWPAGARHVFPELSSAQIAQAIRQQAEQEERQGGAVLSQALRALAPVGDRLRCVLARGEAATEIIAQARAHSIDLIVVGSRGLGPLRGWLLGSVSRHLVRHAPCSVLVVKGRDA